MRERIETPLWSLDKNKIEAITKDEKVINFYTNGGAILEATFKDDKSRDHIYKRLHNWYDGKLAAGLSVFNIPEQILNARS